MGSVLDLIQSIIIAGTIALLVLGVHFMTMRSSTENRVIHQLQGLADGTVAVLQEEIRFLQSFCSDEVRVKSNSLYFRNKFDHIVYIEAHNDSLVVARYTIDTTNEILNGNVLEFISLNSIRIISGQAIPAGYVIDLSSPITGEDGQTKIIHSYHNDGTITIKGVWDITPEVMPYYSIYEAQPIYHSNYSLHLADRSAENRFLFNLVSIDTSGLEVSYLSPSISSKIVDLIRVEIAIQSNPEQLFQPHSQDFIVELQKDFFLRGHRLFSSEEM